ncbi:MAG: SDR family NAD(P)-dependent oxidoreductase [Bacteroidetes bacterium]|nr:SDR family NAD(P)-dependent oxidoreductase [Bacteroidota bacterium]
MPEFKEKYGPVALIAGASEGLGAAWAKALAARGLDLVLVARRKELLDKIATELINQYKINVQIIPCDLSLSDATQFILNATTDIKINCLVYNAASSYIGPFRGTELTTHLDISSVNIVNPLKLVYALSGSMLKDKRGAIILMSSLAGFRGSGFLATYAASKAFSRIFAEGLWYEWKSKGVDVIACCAGATTTPNYINSKPGKINFAAPRPQIPEDVVEECLRKIGKTPSFTSGMGNKIATFIMQHILPRKKTIRIMGDTTRKMYGVKD